MNQASTPTRPPSNRLLARVTDIGAWLYEHKPTWRAFVIAFVLIVLTGAGFRQLTLKAVESEYFALPWRSSVLLEEYLNHLREYQGPMIAMIGDSTLQPLPQLPKSATIPYFVQEQLRSRSANQYWKVANFGLTGAHTGDMMRLAQLVPNNTRLAVITLNYKFLGPMADKPVFVFPELAQLTGEAPVYGALPPKMKIKAFPNHLRREVRDRWYLLRNANWITDQYLGDRPGSVLRRELTAITGEDRWTPSYIDKMRAAFNVETIGPENVAVRHLGKMMMTLRNRRIKMIVYATPLDWDHIYQYKIAAPQKVINQIGQLGKIINQSGALFIDLTVAGQADWFLDIDHLTVKGREEVSRILVDQTMERLRTHAGGNP